MKEWFIKYYKTLIVSAFLIPIITVAVVSISHVTVWYGITNPISWAVYLSVGVEIAALSSLASISGNVGKNVYFSFGIVTLIQFLGNVFYSYSYIDVNSLSFKNWVDLVSPLTGLMGVETTNIIGNKRFLALLTGGFLPLISLSFLHMLVKYTEQNENVIDNDEMDTTQPINDNSDEKMLKLSELELAKLEERLSMYKPKVFSLNNTPVIKKRPKKRKYTRKTPPTQVLTEEPIHDTPEHIEPDVEDLNEVSEEITRDIQIGKLKKNKRDDNGFKIQRL
jgi:hypothetical protein